MKINIISDLHCDINDVTGKIDWMDFKPENLLPADYLIVAGDSGLLEYEGKVHQELRERTKGKFKRVLTIKGNHSYWNVEPNSRYSDPALDKVMAPNDFINVVDGDVAIIGTTLWTNSVRFSEVNMMNDYNFIPQFSPELKLSRFKDESNWLREKYNLYKSQGKKIVIVTHHNPRSRRILPEYSQEHYDVPTAYWVENGELDDIKPDIWVCGHIHESIDTIEDGVRFIRHPIGYRYGWYRHYFEINQNEVQSWYDKVVEI